MQGNDRLFIQADALQQLEAQVARLLCAYQQLKDEKESVQGQLDQVVEQSTLAEQNNQLARQQLVDVLAQLAVIEGKV